MQTWNIFVSYLWSQPCNVNEISNFCTYINIHMSYIFSVLYFLSIFLRCVLVAVAASPIFGGNTVSLPIEIFYFDWISIGFSVIISFKIGKKLFMLVRYQMPYLPHHNITQSAIKNEGKEHVILEICYSWGDLLSYHSWIFMQIFKFCDCITCTYSPWYSNMYLMSSFF